jgi:hypothetical protein
MVSQIVAAAMLGEGIVVGTIAYVIYRRKAAKLALCYRMLGQVTDVKEHPGNEGTPLKHPVIHYTAMNGREVTFESKVGRSNWDVKRGDLLEILVSPEDPAEAEIANFMAQWAMPIVLAVAAVGSVIGGAAVYLFVRF